MGDDVVVVVGWLQEVLLAGGVFCRVDAGGYLVSGDFEFGVECQSFKAWVEDTDSVAVIVSEWSGVTLVFSWDLESHDLLGGVFGFSGPFRFHVRRAFQEPSVELGDVNDFKRLVLKGGLVAGVRAADELVCLADDGCTRPRRLSLAAWRKLGFVVGYQDGRDASYVLSWSAVDWLVQDSVQSWAYLERVGQHVDMLERALGVTGG